MPSLRLQVVDLGTFMRDVALSPKLGDAAQTRIIMTWASGDLELQSIMQVCACFVRVLACVCVCVCVCVCPCLRA